MCLVSLNVVMVSSQGFFNVVMGSSHRFGIYQCCHGVQSYVWCFSILSWNSVVCLVFLNVVMGSSRMFGVSQCSHGSIESYVWCPSMLSWSPVVCFVSLNVVMEVLSRMFGVSQCCHGVQSYASCLSM